MSFGPLYALWSVFAGREATKVNFNSTDYVFLLHSFFFFLYIASGSCCRCFCLAESLQQSRLAVWCLAAAVCVTQRPLSNECCLGTVFAFLFTPKQHLKIWVDSKKVRHKTMCLYAVFDPDGFQLQPICLLLLYVFYYKTITCNLKVGLDNPELLPRRPSQLLLFFSDGSFILLWYFPNTDFRSERWNFRCSQLEIRSAGNLIYLYCLDVIRLFQSVSISFYKDEAEA